MQKIASWQQYRKGIVKEVGQIPDEMQIRFTKEQKRQAKYDDIERHHLTEAEREKQRNPFYWKAKQSAAQKARLALKKKREEEST